MSDTELHGPIDFVLMEFPDQDPSGEAAAALADLVEAGTIRLYDILAVRKDADGVISGFEVSDLGDGSMAFSSFAGARSGLLGDDDVAVLREWGFFGKRAILAHGVQLRDEEMERISRDGTRIVHCPSANLKLGSGIADVQQLDDRGVALALGADGAPCNNNMDPWIELRRAALLAKAKSSTTALPARRALRLATIDGAVALGLDHQVGSLEVGKRADVVVVRLDGVHAEPGGDVFSKLVYACTSRDVEHVMIDGELVVKGGEHTRLDVARVKAQAREQARKVIARSGV